MAEPEIGNSQPGATRTAASEEIHDVMRILHAVYFESELRQRPRRWNEEKVGPGNLVRRAPHHICNSNANDSVIVRKVNEFPERKDSFVGRCEHELHQARSGLS